MNHFNGATVLVVGGEGFIGQHLVSKLCNLKAYVVSLGTKVHSETKAHKYLSVDIRDKGRLASLLKEFDFEYIFNFCGYINHTPYFKNGRDVIDVHFIGLLNLLDQTCGSQLKCFVNVGSSDEYGDNVSPQNEAMREDAISPYSVAKVAETQLIQTLAKTENFPGVVVRPFLVYGPGQNMSRFIPQVISGCLEDLDFPVSKGEQLRDFCFIEDIIEGVLLAATKKDALGEVINLASGNPTSICSIIKEVVGITGGGSPQWGGVSYRIGENMRLYADITKAKRILKWKPKTTIKEGLKETVDFYKKIKLL